MSVYNLQRYIWTMSVDLSTSVSYSLMNVCWLVSTVICNHQHHFIYIISQS